MAKKPAPKKKTTSVKPVSAKTASSAAKKTAAAKPAAKPKGKAVAKSTVKPAVKAASVKITKPSQASAPKAKPALMTKKGKKADIEAEEIEEVQAPIKKRTVVSMLESDPGSDEPIRAEKVSKIKPVKIERGNLADEKAKWAELYKKYGKEKAVQYKMSEKFPNMVPMQHKVLGWGFILTNENDRLEVLFETGIRMLISNYKA